MSVGTVPACCTIAASMPGVDGSSRALNPPSLNPPPSTVSGPRLECRPPPRLSGATDNGAAAAVAAAVASVGPGMCSGSGSLTRSDLGRCGLGLKVQVSLVGFKVQISLVGLGSYMGERVACKQAGVTGQPGNYSTATVMKHARVEGLWTARVGALVMRLHQMVLQLCPRQLL